MTYDEKTAERIRGVLKRRRGVLEKKMFGGIAFLLNGNMCCGVLKKDIVLRLGERGAAQALKKPHARPMDFTGKPLKGMIYLGPAGYRTPAKLRAWIDQSVAFAKSLPKK